MPAIEAPMFRPLPLLSNPHVQTVIAHLTGWGHHRLPTTSSLVPLPDGDVMGLHESTPDQWSGRDCVLLIHGLGGCHNSPYMRRVARRLVRLGLRVYRVDLRGAGHAAAHCDKLYNAACSHDVRVVFQAIRGANPESRIHVVGFSLGGNIALKLVGEANDHPLPGLASVAAVAAPIDLVRCSDLISAIPFYDRFYLRELKKQVESHAKLRPHLTPPVWPKTMTLRTFDDVYTAPRGGFVDASDYYAKASARPLVPRIGVPAYLLTAQDDPFVAWQPFAELPAREGQRVHIMPRGGHLGFLGPDGKGGIRWAETQIVDWLAEQASCNHDSADGQ